MQARSLLLVLLLACGDPDAAGIDAASSGDAGDDDDAPSGAPLTPVFFSDWRTASLGTDDAIVGDAGKWDTVAGDNRGEIIDAPEGFPTAHALLVEYKGDGFVRLRKNGLPVPAIGERRNYRWYYRHDQPNWPQDNSQHPMQDGNAQGDISWGFNTETVSDTTWRNYFGVQVNNDENPYEMGRWYSPLLTTGTVYRYELQIHRTAETTFQLHAALFGADGTLIHDNAAFTNARDGGPVSLANTPTFTFNQNTSLAFYNADTLNGLNAGCNGIAGVTEEGFDYAVQGAFAIVDGLEVGTFIGPYGSVEGEVP